jgi:hypothetical protein
MEIIFSTYRHNIINMKGVNGYPENLIQNILVKILLNADDIMLWTNTAKE